MEDAQKERTQGGVLADKAGGRLAGHGRRKSPRKYFRLPEEEKRKFLLRPEEQMKARGLLRRRIAAGARTIREGPGWKWRTRKRRGHKADKADKAGGGRKQ